MVSFTERNKNLSKEQQKTKPITQKRENSMLSNLLVQQLRLQLLPK